MTSAQRRSYQSVANERHRRKHGSDKYAISTTCIRSGCDEPRLLGNVCGAHLFLEMYTEPRRPRSQAKQNSKKLRLDGIKVATGCVDGGYCSGQLTARMLHFHHTDPPTKSFELNAHGISGRPWDEIEAELAKCVVLCALCHTARHESGLL